MARRLGPALAAVVCAGACTYHFDRDYDPRDASGDASGADGGVPADAGDAAVIGCEGAADGTPCSGGACIAGACCSGCITPDGCQAGDVVDACGFGGAVCQRCSGDTPLCIENRCRVEHPIVQAAVGGDHYCALDHEGRVYCWGSDRSGQLGVREPSGACDAAEPLLVPLPMAAREVRAEFNGTCAVLIDGSGWCWGAGLAGAGTDSPASTCIDGASTVTRFSPASIDPVRVVPSEPPLTWRSIGVGRLVRFGLNEAGVAFFWGDYFSASSMPIDQPFRVTGTPPPLVSLSVDTQFAMAVDAEGGLYAWGERTPVPGAGSSITTEPLVRDVVLFTAGLDHACWSYADGSIECRGLFSLSSWEPGPAGGRLVPRPDSGPITSMVITYLSTTLSVCWVNQARELWCHRSTAPELPLAREVVDIYAGNSDFGALDAAGRLWTWHIANGPDAARATVLPP